MTALFHELIYQPLYNLLILFYNLVPGADFGVAIILITIFLRTILVPVYKKQIESQQKIQALQPKIKELQQKHKNDKETQTRELMALYKTHKTNPFSGCLPIIVQLIFLLAIYRILLNISAAGLTIKPEELYSFVKDPGQINSLFLGIVDLTKRNLPIAALAAIAQYYQTKMLMKKSISEKGSSEASTEPDFAEIMNKQMLYLGPVLTLVIGAQFPAGLSLYWLTSTVYMLLQQIKMEKRNQEA